MWPQRGTTFLPAGASAYRHLLEPEKDGEGFFLNGRATWWVRAGEACGGLAQPWGKKERSRRPLDHSSWDPSARSAAPPLPRRFEHPHTGSCGYGRLDGYAFGTDAVAAMPDVNPDWKAGSCGRCYELKCRGIRARRWRQGTGRGSRGGGENRARAGCLGCLLHFPRHCLPTHLPAPRPAGPPPPPCQAAPTALWTWIAPMPATTTAPRSSSRLWTPAPARATRWGGGTGEGPPAQGRAGQEPCKGKPAPAPHLRRPAHPSPAAAEVVLRRRRPGTFRP